MPFTGERASSPMGSARSSRSISASISGVSAMAMASAAAIRRGSGSRESGRRGSGVSSPSRWRALSVRSVGMAALKYSQTSLPTSSENHHHSGRKIRRSQRVGRMRMAKGGRPLFGEQQRFMLFLIAPAALLLTLFQVLPIAIGANASFRNWALYNPKKTWVGLDHYYAVISDPAFLYVVLPNTFLFMALSVAGALVVGLALALLLNRPFRSQKFVQTILLVPLMVAPV